MDARIIRSASRPVSGKKLDELREERKQTEKKTKFQRDLDSDWTVKNKKSFFGMKEHASIDVESGLVLFSTVSKASEHDTNHFFFVVANSLHGDNLKAYADKAYCSEANRDFLKMNGIGDGIMRKNQINAELTENEIKRNKEISKVRYKIEQYFGITGKYHGAGKARFPSLVKEGWDHLCGAIAFNVKRVVLGIRKQETTVTA